MTRLPPLVAALLAVSLAVAAPTPARAGADWFPPKPVQSFIPSATIAPGQSWPLEFILRANVAPADLRWTLSASGDFTAGLSATEGAVSLAAGQQAAISVTVTVPSGLSGPMASFVTLRVFYDPGTLVAAPNAIATIRAATGGRPEFYPVPSTVTAAAGGPATVTYELKSTITGSEAFDLQVLRLNPDENNGSNLFPYTLPSSPVTLPALGTVQVAVPLYLPGNAYPGNLNSFSVTASSVSDVNKGISDAKGHAQITSADPDSLPVTLVPIGLVPQEQAASGRDGPVLVPGRELWLISSGDLGVRVLRDSALNQIGKIDRDPNGLDDRLVGRIRTPQFAAAAAVVPGFINSAQEVLDLGLLAAGHGGLYLLDLRDIVEPPIGTWEDFYDLDGDGVDDRILRMIPTGGFATDVEWFRTPEGRVVAVVASADTGSNPVTAGFNPALVVPGSGAGLVAIDVLAALDSLPGVPFVAGAQATPGNALDVELRGGPQPQAAVADGEGGVQLYGLAASGSPASLAFTWQGAVALDGTWGTPYARDLAWVPNSDDSLYLAVAAAGAGLEIVRATPGQAPYTALVQRTEAPAIGVATARTGNVAVAMGTAGAHLFRLPSRGELDRVSPTASPPYLAPVVLDHDASWTEGRPLEIGYHGAYSSSITALRFRPMVGVQIPDILCADGPRTLVLQPGPAALVGVGQFPGSLAPGLRLLVMPNPVAARAEFQVRGEGLWPAADGGPVAFEIFDVQGRLVRRLTPAAPGGGAVARATWDGRDRSGRPVGPGRYWLLASRRGGWQARAGFVVIR